MKTILTIALIAFTLNCFGQESDDSYSASPKPVNIKQNPLPLDSVSGKIIYKKIIQVDSVKKEQIYSRAKLWIANNYKSAKDVIQMDDKDAGIIIVKGNIPDIILTYKALWTTNYLTANAPHTLKISIRDCKCKIEIYDISIKYYYSASQYSAGGESEKTIEELYPISKQNGKLTKSFLESYAQATDKVDSDAKDLMNSFEKDIKISAVANDKW